MKTFDEIYEELQNADNTELNNLWIKAKKDSDKAKKTAKIICLAIDIFFVIVVLKNIINSGSLFLVLHMTIFILILNVMVFGISIGISGVSKDQIQFKAKYKNTVIKKLMNNFYNNLEYFPNKSMPKYIYEKLNYEYYNRYKSEDYFEAQINGKHSIQMAEILTQEVTTHRDSKGRTSTTTTTKFYGLFAKVVMHKSIKGQLKIMQNGAFLLDKRLKMDSSEFEKYFDVQASNQIVGMQLLTADVMEELIEFENKTKMKFDIFIKENELYLRFHSGEMFEVGDFENGPLDKNAIQKYFYMLNFTYNLSNKLINIINDTEI